MTLPSDPLKERGARSVLFVRFGTFFRLCLASGLLHAAQADAAAVTVVLNPAADTSIFEENGDASDAKSPGLFAGRTNNDAIRRAFLRFDVAGSVPAGILVSSVTLRLSLTRSNSGFVYASLFRVSAAWSEGTSNAGLPGGTGAAATPGDATWTRRVYPGTFWLNPGGDAAATSSGTTLIGTALTDYVFTTTPSLVADVQGWLDQPATNFGWQLRVDETQIAPTAKRFGSRENTLQPLLFVTYDDASAAAPPPAVPALDAPMLEILALLLAAGGARLLNRGS
ncbi:MAG TPA: DNRLRE domain-containing protein [Thermoanaerobaculia bacterium]|nr:DNRLRE domain-containing protein [Thermoanaerobaculia bacterium]